MKATITAVKGLMIMSAILMLFFMWGVAKELYQNITHANQVMADGAQFKAKRAEEAPSVPVTDWDDLLARKAEKYHVPVGMLWVVFRHESLSGKQNYRFEPGKMDVALRLTKNVNEARMLASSHCPFHVMGTTALQYGSTWERITKSDDECADVGTHYLADCLGVHDGKPMFEQVFGAFRCYNAGAKARGDAGVDYAANRTSEFFGQLLADLYPNGLRVSDNG